LLLGVKILAPKNRSTSNKVAYENPVTKFLELPKKEIMQTLKISKEKNYIFNE
jgi:hypothetical protein